MPSNESAQQTQQCWSSAGYTRFPCMLNAHSVLALKTGAQQLRAGGIFLADSHHKVKPTPGLACFWPGWQSHGVWIEQLRIIHGVKTTHAWAEVKMITSPRKQTIGTTVEFKRVTSHLKVAGNSCLGWPTNQGVDWSHSAGKQTVCQQLQL